MNYMQVFNTNNQSTDDKLRDYCDGTAYKTHKLFQKDPCGFQIHLHYDDLELCNPLGTKAGRHKIGKYIN